jgi:hypothetical protein
MGLLLSTEAAAAAGISYHQLQELFRHGHMKRPATYRAGAFWWTEAEVQELRQVVESRKQARSRKVMA